MKHSVNDGLRARVASGQVRVRVRARVRVRVRVGVGVRARARARARRVASGQACLPPQLTLAQP